MLAETRREISTHEESVGLCDFARSIVVRIDIFELVAQILLNHRFHVLGEIYESLFDRARIGPNALADKEFKLVTKVHERGETFAESNGINEGKARFGRGD